MKISLTTNNLLRAAAIVCLVAFIANASANPDADFLVRSFPEKVGSFARLSVAKNEAAIHGDIIDAVVAKYASGANKIEWSGTEFVAPDQAFAALQSMVDSYEKEGAGVSSVKNVAGEIRYR